ncbi:MAG: rod shape-determining protein MreD [Pseudomonadota bacterium]
MSIRPLHLQQRLRHTVPFLLGVFAVFVDLAPRPAAAGGGIGPFFTLVVVYFWCVYRPDLMSHAAVFVIGLLHDLMSGLPLGCTALAFVLGRAALIARHRFFHAKSFTVIWGLFVLLVAGVEVTRFAIASVVIGGAVDPTPLVVQSILTVALYPAVSWALVRVHGHVVVGGDAEP